MANARRRTQQEMASSPKTSYNRLSEYVTHQAASGNEARLQAEVVEAENRKSRKQGKIKTVKVDSNPVPTGRTRVGNLAGGAIRGGMGGIGAFSLKQIR